MNDTYILQNTQLIDFRETPYQLEPMLQHMESVGRIAYRSDDRITPDSAVKFIERMKESGHYSVLEHSNIVVYYTYNPKSENSWSPWNLLRERLVYHPYYIRYDNGFNSGLNQVQLSGSYRAWLETIKTDGGSWFLPILYQEFPTLFPKTYKCGIDGLVIRDYIHPSVKRYTSIIVCDRGISHEIVRHRVFSFLQESTRYVNYNNKPPVIIKDRWSNHKRDLVEQALDTYTKLLQNGESLQQARDVLPNCLGARIAMTGIIRDYEHFISLRTAPDAHPRIQTIAYAIKEKIERLKEDE